MRTTIDRAGRLVIPKAIRDAVGLQAGMPLDIRVHDGRIEIEPENVAVKLVRRPGGLLVAVPTGDTEPLTTAVVQHVMENLREQRDQADED